MSNDIELTRACARLACMLAQGKTPIKKDYSKEWDLLKNKNYYKNSKGRT